MIASLEDALSWYRDAKSVAGWMGRMGTRYWDDPSLASLLALDTRFRQIEGTEIELRVGRTLADLDDLGVLLLFSVFEAVVRAQAINDIDKEIPTAHHPALRHALNGLHESIEHGSFAKVLEGYKELDADLVEQVSQVRRYRNWVAHGRRGQPPGGMDPDLAYARLQRFLTLMQQRPKVAPAE